MAAALLAGVWTGLGMGEGEEHRLDRTGPNCGTVTCAGARIGDEPCWTRPSCPLVCIRVRGGGRPRLQQSPARAGTGDRPGQAAASDGKAGG